MSNKKCAATVVVKRVDGCILVVSRRDKPTDFGLPGGKLEEYETFEQAAKRECLEETGVNIDNASLKEIYSSNSVGENKFVVKTFIASEYTPSYDVEPEPNVNFFSYDGIVARWQKEEDFKIGTFRDYNEQVLKRLNGNLKEGK